MRRILALLTAPLAALVLAPAAGAQTEHITIALPTIAAIFASAYIAQDAGIYRKNGLDVTEQVILGPGAANAVIAGSVQFSESAGTTLTRAVAHGQPLIAVANVYDRTGLWIVVTKKVAEERHFDPKAPLAERAKLMKGLRFNVVGIQSIPHAFANVIAKAGGLDPETDMTVTAIAPSDTVPAMQRNAIDGFSGGPPQVEQAVESGVGVIIADGNDAPVDPPWLARVAGNVVLVRPQTCTEHRSVCEKMGKSMVAANVYLHEHAQEAMAILSKRLNITDKVLEDTYKRVIEASPTSPVVDAKELATADDLNVAAGFLKTSEKLQSYDPLFTNEYVK